MNWKVYEVIPLQWNEEHRREIERIAYFMWLDSGKPEGQDLKFWGLAETKYLFPYPTKIVMGEGFYSDLDGSMKPVNISIDPENFQPRTAILTRYGKKLLEREKLKSANLDE